MKRRGFLSMVSAAAVAPVLPAISAPAVSATYSRYMFGLAVFHARTRAHVSAAGIAFRLKITTVQAEAMIAEMATKGMVTPVLGKPGAVRAVSNIVKPGIWDVTNSASSSPHRTKDALHSSDIAQTRSMITHLRTLCAGQGIPLAPHCLAGTA